MTIKDDRIAELEQIVAQQAQQIQELLLRIGQLELELARAKKDSSNSSKAPSSDIVKPPAKKSSGDRRKKAKRGGQPGHERKLREPLPPERVDEQITYEIDEAELRERGLTPTDEFEIVQHIELLELPIFVTEHRLRKYLTLEGQVVLPDAGDLRSQPIFGPRLLAMIGWLKSQAHCSYSTIETWMEDVLCVPVSRGYLSKLCNDVISDSLSDCHQELKQALPTQEQLGSDESSLKNNGKKHWIWCLTAPLFTLFQIAPNRSRAVLEELIGPDYEGHLNCDYYSSNCSFAWNFDVKAQYCWAHLIRDIRFLLKHPQYSTRVWAQQLLDRSRRLFQAWHRREEMSEAGFPRSMLTHRNRFLEIVRRPPWSQEAKALAARFEIVELEDGGFYDLSVDYFRFLFEAGLEPTNNHTEQQMRHCVIDRRITQGTRSEKGQRYHERMWTAIATCSKQGLSFFGFLQDSLSSKLKGNSPPSLLPH